MSSYLHTNQQQYKDNPRLHVPCQDFKSFLLNIYWLIYNNPFSTQAYTLDSSTLLFSWDCYGWNSWTHFYSICRNLTLHKKIYDAKSTRVSIQCGLVTHKSMGCQMDIYSAFSDISESILPISVNRYTDICKSFPDIGNSISRYR